MKRVKLLFVLCLFTGIICQAQFPAPHSFKMSGYYILLDESGWCCGNYVVGPTYCTDFQWEAPDLSETEAQLTGYNIYYYEGQYYEDMEIPFSEAKIIAHTTNTHLQMKLGIIGIVWITAVYSDPEGESESSNIAVNEKLPLAIKKVDKPQFSLIYNKQRDGIEIKGVENITSFSIFRLDGIEIPIPTMSDFIDTKSMGKGVYIVKRTMKDAKIIVEKLVIR